MRKFADIAVLVEEVVVEEQSLVRIHVAPASLKDWCLCLQLLNDNLVEAFTVRRVSSVKTMQVGRGEGGYSDTTCDANGLALKLSARDLDFARHFFLRYYRDAAAEVDHIDIETEEGGYVIFSVEESVPPVSSEEAKRRLDM